MKLEWHDAYSTGIPHLDAQHQTLFNHLNALNAASTSARPAPALLETLDFLIAYVAVHFRDEEACMAQHNCPAAAENKAAHERLTAMLLSYRKKVRTRGPTPALKVEIKHQLQQWVESHICKIDCQLRHSISKSV